MRQVPQWKEVKLSPRVRILNYLNTLKAEINFGHSH